MTRYLAWPGHHDEAHNKYNNGKYLIFFCSEGNRTVKLCKLEGISLFVFK